MFPKKWLSFKKKELPAQEGAPVFEAEPKTSEDEPTERKVPDHKGQYGLIHLNPKSDDLASVVSEETYSLDIVAVHGITGDAFSTWTHENGNNWLHDLPKAFPGARVFSYGYPAEIFWSRSRGNLDSFARSLLEDLKRERKQLKDQSRHIIFICHSMGGIVVKKALMIACLEALHYSKIHSSISAILFLSTPHRGSPVASLALPLIGLAKIVNIPLSSFVGNIRTDLVQGLGKDSDPLMEITKGFRNQMANIKVASFFEKSVTRPLNTVIVDENSAIIGFPEERIVPMHDCDHRTICRFEADTSNSYKTILGVLQDWADEAKKNEKELSSNDLSCLNSLAFLEMNYRRPDADRAHPNTCKWILQHDSYTKWLSKKRGLLWIKGKPGAGKSTLLAFIYRIFQTRNSDQTDLSLEFFFHGRGTLLQKNSVGMFRSLLHQLYTRVSSIRRPILNAFRDKEVYGEAGKGWEWSLRELQDLFFKSFLAASKSGKIVIFIDALDEAGTEARELVDYFHELNDQLDKTDSSAALCISCRHYPVTALIAGLDVLVEENNSDDISRYVHSKLQANTHKEETGPDLGQWKEIECEIVNNASGVFQWARLVVRLVLDHYEDGESWNDIRLMLARVPRELEDVYAHILNNIIKPERRKKTLHLMQWIYLAELPLQIKSIRLAMAFDDTYISPSLQSYQDAERSADAEARMEKLVNSLSGGLAEVKRYRSNISYKGGATVQFIHQSVNDFMFSKGLEFLVSKADDNVRETDSREQKTLNRSEIIGQSQDRLSRSCMNYLRLSIPELKPEDFKSMVFVPKKNTDLGEDIPTGAPHVPWGRLEEESKVDETYRTRFPFIYYAANLWFIHAQKAERRGISQVHIAKQFNQTDELLGKWVKIYNDDEERPKFADGVVFLHVAAGLNLQSIVRTLLEEGAFIGAEDRSGNTALHYAAREGHIEMVEMLLNAGADSGASNVENSTPIELAAWSEHGEIVKMLLRRGANVKNALQVAAFQGSISLVRYLLDSGVDINICGGEHGTALQGAVVKNHWDLVRFLIEHGANVNIVGGYYGSALQAAAAKEGWDLVRLLLQHGADVNLQGGLHGNPLQAAALTGNISITQMLLACGADVTAQGGKHGNALQAAARHGSTKLVELILHKGADINAQGGIYGNALQAACRGATVPARTVTVSYLIENGADINAQGGLYGTAFQAAACVTDGHFILKELLENGAVEVNVPGAKFPNAVQAAAYCAHRENVMFLLRRGARFYEDDADFNERLWKASEMNDWEVTHLLAERGFPIENWRIVWF